jgi:leucyl/phenylalanyl-tRNA---protein transferase
MQLAWLDELSPFPASALALGPDSDAPGLLAAGGGLSVARLRAAYERGIFPWYSAGQPVLWWTPDPRMVLPVAEFKFQRSLRKAAQKFLNTPGCEVRFDADFDAVIQACAQTPREGQPGTWIVPEMVQAYSALFRAGIAHCVETRVDGQLVGGLYGVQIGGMIYGESMFSHRTDASKIALAALVANCRTRGVTLIDCQQHTGHLASLGARTWPRAQFEAHLAATVHQAVDTRWIYDPYDWLALGLQLPPRSADTLP